MPVTVTIHFKELGDVDFTTSNSQSYNFIPRVGDIVTPTDTDTICKVIAVVPKGFAATEDSEIIADIYAVELPVDFDSYILSLT
ncbi:MAG: hypothetical protein ACHP6H_06935 [Legionellales bacterium]